MIDYVGIQRAFTRITEAKTVVEAYDAKMEAYDNLSYDDGDRLYDMLCNLTNKRTDPRVVHMGLNTTKGDPKWEELKQSIRDIVEQDGICSASWSCEGRTRHQWQSEVLAKEMPEYKFDIGYNYKCDIRKR